MKTNLTLAMVALALLLQQASANELTVEGDRSAAAVSQLQAWLRTPRADRKPIAEQPLVATALTKADAAAAQELLWADHAEFIKATRTEEMQAKALTDGDATMKFDTIVFPSKEAGAGDTKADGSEAKDSSHPALFISMHGGGNAPPRVNDSQWRNQLKLANGYQPVNAIYVAPRAPSNSWDLWHTPIVDKLFGRLIENMIVLNNVDPDQVYLMGYSAGGDGAYQLAPRLADRLAAASAMAGHPNNASPSGLRNLPFTIHVGGEDAAYGRNQVAADWDKQLNALEQADPQGYKHFVHVHAGKGHWMDLDDKEAIPWMQKFHRNPLPDRIVWRQGNTVHERFYWLAVEQPGANGGDEIVAQRNGQTISVDVNSGTPKWRVRLSDAMLNLDEPLTITLGGKPLFQGKLPRTIGTLARTIEERGDPQSVFSAEYRAPAK